MLMIVCKNIYKTVVIKICASICTIRWQQMRDFRISFSRALSMHSHTLYNSCICMSGAVHPCFAPLTVSKHSSAVMSPTVWEPNLLSEVEVYQVRGEGGGAAKFLCVCVCEGASVFVCCWSRSHLPYLWGFDSSLNRSRAKRCVFGLWETPAKSHLHAPQLEDARVWEGVRHVCLPLCESSNLFSCHTERGCSSLWFIQKVSSPGGI